MSEDLYAQVMMTEAPDTRTPFDIATRASSNRAASGADRV